MTALVRAASLSSYESLAASLGLDVARELRRVGLSRRSLAQPEALISYLSLIHLLEHSAVAAACPDFGQRLARLQNLDVLGPLAVLLRHAATLGEAVRLASSYIFVHSPAVRFVLQDVAGRPAQVDLCFAIEMPALPPHAQTLELSLGVMLQGLRLLRPGEAQPLLALFPHARQGPLASYAESYGCDCRFDADRCALRLWRRDLERPILSHDPHVRAMAETYLAQQFPAPEQAVADRVRALLRHLLDAGQASQRHVAEAMSIHPSTLQRRLAAEGWHFEQILDELRRDKLLDLLRPVTRLSLTQIALMLGYSEQAALTRSCKRWYGCTPSALRKDEAYLVKNASMRSANLP